jgi:hypothetical protein
VDRVVVGGAHKVRIIYIKAWRTMGFFSRKNRLWSFFRAKSGLWGFFALLIDWLLGHLMVVVLLGRIGVRVRIRTVILYT